MGFDRIREQIGRVLVYLSDDLIEVMLEIFVIWLLVLVVVRFLQGTRGARVIKGVMLLMILTTLTISVSGAENQFERIGFLYDKSLGAITLGLVIVFQPEIRRALVRLGEARLFRGGPLRRARVIEEVIGSFAYLSKNKIGAMIAIERQVGLGGIIEAGTRLDAAVSRAILNTIFWPGSALHDMGVVIRGDRIIAAGVPFPLAEGEQVSQELGSRHRAAIGLSQETDALILVISEETGVISLSERGRLIRELSVDEVRRRLIEGLGQTELLAQADDETGGASTA